jgi:NAD(P)-dependent dehydrogenase (short-subunit alcohol dehydrogenase family)
VKLDDTVALVTGGGKRVGRAIALELARAGCHVAIHYRQSEAEATQVADEVTTLGRLAITVRGDLEEPASWPAVIRETVDNLGRLDTLVNNASTFLPDVPDTVEAFDPTVWERVLRVNLAAPMGLCHHARSYLTEHGHGKIVNLSDISARRPWPDHLAYCVSKAGLDALTKGLARALAPAIQVNGVALGIAAFPDEYSEALRRQLISRVPLGRAGTPEEAAEVVRFLVETADYMTGQVVRIDGGRSID